MRKENSDHLRELIQALPKIEEALETLQQHKVLLFVHCLLEDKLFDPSKRFYPQATDTSQVILGCRAALEQINMLADALRNQQQELAESATDDLELE